MRDFILNKRPSEWSSRYYLFDSDNVVFFSELGKKQHVMVEAKYRA